MGSHSTVAGVARALTCHNVTAYRYGETQPLAYDASFHILVPLAAGATPATR